MSQSCCVLRGETGGNIYSVSKAWLLPSQFMSRFYLPYSKPNTFLFFLLLSSLKLTRTYTIHAQKGDLKSLFCQTKRAKKNKSSTQTCPPGKISPSSIELLANRPQRKKFPRTPTHEEEEVGLISPDIHGGT